jgi:HEAT repeat protein
VIVALLCAAPADDARAERGRAAEVKLDLEKLKADLESAQEPRMLAALATISSAGAAGVPAAPYVEAVLLRGASQTVLERALVVAGELGQASSSAAIAPYLRHRAAALRRAAAEALTRTGGKPAIAALRLGLRGRDAEVRAACARGLGELGAHEAVDDLFRALQHKVTAAAASIGMLCAPAQCDRFTALLERQPLEAMLDGMERILLRPGEQVPDEQKLGVVAALLELGSPRVGHFLRQVSDRFPPDGSPAVKEALFEAAEMLGAKAGKQ